MNSLKIRKTLIASLIATLSMSAVAEDRTLKLDYDTGLAVSSDVVYRKLYRCDD